MNIWFYRPVPNWKRGISPRCYCQKLCFCNQLQQVKTQQTPPDHHKRALHSLQLSSRFSNYQRCFLLLFTFPFLFFSFVPLKAPPLVSITASVWNGKSILNRHRDHRILLVFSLLSPPSFLWASLLISVSCGYSLYCKIDSRTDM